MHQALQTLPWAQRALVLGGGDGLAVREILRRTNISTSRWWTWTAMTDLFSATPYLAGLNGRRPQRPQVTVINMTPAGG